MIACMVMRVLSRSCARLSVCSAVTGSLGIRVIFNGPCVLVGKDMEVPSCVEQMNVEPFV